MNTTDRINKFFEEMDLNTSNRVAAKPMSQLGGKMLKVKDVVESDRDPSVIATCSFVRERPKVVIYKWEYSDHEKFVRMAMRLARELDIPFEYVP